MPSIADLDQDGSPEVIVESQILDGKTGTPEVAAFTPANTANLVVSDVDGDGKLDLVTGSRAYKADGTLIAQTGLAASYVAVGDFDKDGVPEIVAANTANHTLVLWHLDPAAAGGFTIVRQGIDINGTLDPNLCNVGSAGNTKGGRPPTIADFNGDGTPDVALAGGVGYAVFDGTKLMDPAIANDKTFLWIKQTQDCSSAATRGRHRRDDAHLRRGRRQGHARLARVPHGQQRLRRRNGPLLGRAELSDPREDFTSNQGDGENLGKAILRLP